MIGCVQLFRLCKVVTYSATDMRILLIAIIVLLTFKWVLIALLLPFQAAYNRYIRGHRTFGLKMLAAPFFLWKKIFRGGWQRFSLYHVSLIPSCHLRRGIYRFLGVRMGKKNVFHFRTEIRGIGNLVIGERNIIGDNVILDARNGLTLGSNINISSNVSIYTMQHDYRHPDFKCPEEPSAVTIGDRVWLGSNVIVLPGVKIGEGAVCCAGCVVTKDVEPYTVVAGIPAKQINERPKDLNYQFDGKSCRLY